MENESTDIKKEAVKETQPLPGIDTIVRNEELHQIWEDGQKTFRLKNLIRLLAIIILLVVLILLIIFGATVIANRDLIYPVNVRGVEGKITLYETAEMDAPCSHLDIPVIKEFDPLAGDVTIPSDIDLTGIGSKNGDGYIAYTFLVKNNEDADLPISEEVTIVSSTKNADKAIRVRIYRNGECTTYAALSKTGIPEYLTEPFVSDETVLRGSTVLKEGQTTRYTIVVWIEGNDPECINDISGGSVRLSFAFSADRS